MLTERDRRIAYYLVCFDVWHLSAHLSSTHILPRWGTRWLFRGMLKRQDVDDHHHAPACNANHWHRCRLVFLPCRCGAAADARIEARDEQRKAEAAARDKVKRTYASMDDYLAAARDGRE